jgi:hypothetical protein
METPFYGTATKAAAKYSDNVEKKAELTVVLRARWKFKIACRKNAVSFPLIVA